MPLMPEWTEITVDEDLLIPVVQELLALAEDPNHVEVVYGASGRVILAEVHLAEFWYLERLKKQEQQERQPAEVQPQPIAPTVVARTNVEPSNDAWSKIPTGRTPAPLKRGTALKPSASLDGEEP